MGYRRHFIGIYGIVLGDSIYIGKSLDIFSRWNSHLQSLFYDTHHNKNLSEIFGDKNYRDCRFLILKLCSKKDLSALEKTTIQEYRDSSEYSVLNIALMGRKKQKAAKIAKVEEDANNQLQDL